MVEKKGEVQKKEGEGERISANSRAKRLYKKIDKNKITFNPCMEVRYHLSPKLCRKQMQSYEKLSSPKIACSIFSSDPSFLSSLYNFLTTFR